MNAASRFRDAAGAPARTLTITFEGQCIAARPGESVAAALLAHTGDPTRRTVVTGKGRTPFCMMGVCFDCLVTIDGRPNVQACMVEVQEGMVVQLQDGAP